MTSKVEERDTPSRKGAGKILGKVQNQLKEKIADRMEDRDGIFAWVTEKSVVVGRSYVWAKRGNMVSCHAEAVKRAEHEDKALVMYIAKRDAYYGFNPFNVLNNKTENRKGNALMFNFDFDMGRQVEVSDV